MNLSSKKAVVLLSSGLDSSIASALANEQGWSIELAITFDYGQRAAHREIEHSRKIAAMLGTTHRVITLPWFSEFKQAGALLSNESLPTPNLAQLSDERFASESAKRVWVPNRNGVMLEIAAGFAEDANCAAVVVGFNSEEAATFPDNSFEYMKALDEALRFSTATGVKIISPTALLDKIEIVAEAKRINFPLADVWTCYESNEKMCGRCESCVRFKRALLANEVVFDAFFEH
jgi:7-cyano-7-deazaguanine synthase